MATKKFEEGRKKTGGRKKGVKNKLTTNIKDMLFSTLNDKRIGGLEGFIKWVGETKGNKILFYTWLMKMLPTSIAGEQDDKGEFKPLKIIISRDGDGTD